jgi:hypothetical protein
VFWWLTKAGRLKHRHDVRYTAHVDSCPRCIAARARLKAGIAQVAAYASMCPTGKLLVLDWHEESGAVVGELAARCRALYQQELREEAAPAPGPRAEA